MTLTEKKTSPYNVDEDVYILDVEIYDKPTCIHGIVKETGDETILIKWDDLSEETEYELSNMPAISFKPIMASSTYTTPIELSNLYAKEQAINQFRKDVNLWYKKKIKAHPSKADEYSSFLKKFNAIKTINRKKKQKMKQLLILLISIIFCSCTVHKDVYYWHNGAYNYTDKPDTLKGKHYYKLNVSYTYKN